MTLTRQASEALDRMYDDQTQNKPVTDLIMSEITDTLKTHGIEPLGDDREAELEAAVYTFVCQCSEAKKESQ